MALLGVAAAVGVAAIGCVTSELRSVGRARETYEDCVAEFSATDPECESLHAQYLNAQALYEENARRAWGCNSREGNCPTPR